MAFVLSEALSIPKVRDRLQHGVPLHELGALVKFYESARNEQFVQKEYGHLFQDLEFLQVSGAMEHPQVPHGAMIASQFHWVAVRGYVNVDPYALNNTGLQHRIIINTPALYAPVITLGNGSWAIYSDILRYGGHRPLDQILYYLLYIIDVVQQSKMPYRIYVNEYFTKHVLWMKPYDEVLEYVTERLEEILKDDEAHGVAQLMSGELCLPRQEWIFSDGWFFNILVPPWVFSHHDGNDYTRNQILGWDFFTVS